MTIQYCSDLHLEFKENKTFLKTHPLRLAGEVLLLAGDITPFTHLDEQADFFRYVSDNFEVVYWLPGNHEYYHSDAAKRSEVLNEKIRSNVFLVNNVSLLYKDVRFIFSVLWSKISPANEWLIERSVSDFSAIRYDGHRFSAPAFNILHQHCLNFLSNEIQKEYTGKTVVVTHHVPTFLHYPVQYKGSIINEAFGVELYGFIEDSGADVWIYGHHHVNTPDFTIGKTKLLTNQLGYVQRSEHLSFDSAKTVTL